MKTFLDYLAEAEQKIGQVVENSNLPAAVDSISPIHGGSNFKDSEKLQRRKKIRNETVPNKNGEFSPLGGTTYSRRPS